MSASTRRDLVLWCVLPGAVIACSSPPQRSSAEGSASTGSRPEELERGVLGLVAGNDTTVIEEYTRTHSTLQGIVRPQIRGAKFGWARYRVEFSPPGRAERATLAMGRRNDEATVVGTWTVTIVGRQVTEVESRGGSSRVTAADGPVVPMFPPSMAMFNEVIRLAHQSGARGRTEVHVYPMASSGEVRTATVEWLAPDTAAVSYYGGPATHYAVDRRGRVLDVWDPRGIEGRHRVVRLQ